MPSCTAWVRRLAPNLENTRLEWVLTVFSLTKSFSAISRLLMPRGDENKDVELAGGDAEVLALAVVGGEGLAGGDRDFLDDDFLAGLGEPEAEPDAERGKGYGNQAGIDFDGVFDHEKVVVRPLQQGDEDAADYTVDEDVALHAESGAWTLKKSVTQGYRGAGWFIDSLALRP